MRKKIILLILLLSIFMIGAVSATKNTTNVVGNDVSDNKITSIKDDTTAVKTNTIKKSS